MKPTYLVPFVLAALAGCAAPTSEAPAPADQPEAAAPAADTAPAAAAEAPVAEAAVANALPDGPIRTEASCLDLQAEALELHPECKTETMAEMAQVRTDVLCTEIDPALLYLYPVCSAVGGGSVVTVAAPEPTPAKEIDQSAWSDPSDYEGSRSVSNITQDLEGNRTATQTSGNLNVSVSTGMDITSTSLWQKAAP